MAKHMRAGQGRDESDFVLNCTGAIQGSHVSHATRGVAMRPCTAI